MIESMRSNLIRLLRWSEKYTKTDMVYLASGSFWLIGGQVLGIFISFAASLVFARVLSPEIYGTYKYAISILSIIGGISLTGLATPIAQAIARGQYRALSNGFWYSLRWGSITMLMFLSASIYYYIGKNHVLGLSMFIASICVPLWSASSLYIAFLSGTKSFGRQTVYGSSINVVVTGGLILASFLVPNALILISIYLIGNTLCSLLFYYLSISEAEQEKYLAHPDIEYNFGWHMSLINLLDRVASNIGAVIVFHFLGAAQLAIYSFALIMPDQIRAILKTGSTLAFPQLVNRHMTEIRGSLYHKTLLSAAVVVLTIIVYVFISPFVFTILFPKYIISIEYSQVLSLSIIAVLGALPLTALQAHARTKELYYYSIATNVFQVAITLTLIPLYGLWGAVICMLVSRLLDFLVPLFLLKRIA